MRQLVFSADARADIRAAFAWLFARNPDAAVRLRDAIIHRCENLLNAPQIGAPRDDILSGMRCVFVRPYAIYYRAGADAVEIVRILHGRRDRRAAFHGEE